MKAGAATNMPSIAIVGGGPGGLTLARILQTRGIACEILEGETHEGVRPQGGSLDLHADGGLRALELSGLMDAFRSLARPEDQITTVYDPSGARLYRDLQPDTPRPEIDRTALRRLLIESLRKGVIQWDRRVVAVERRPDGRCNVLSANGERRTYDLVVGADGAWSKVRSQLTDTVPHYEGVTLAELNCVGFDARFPQLADIAGRGTLFTFDRGKGLIAQRSDGDRLRIYAVIEARPTEIADAFASLTAKERKAWILARYADWSPDLRMLIEACSDEVLPRPIYALPVGLTWSRRSGITLIGDAAHLMSPFAGEGVNMAMADAADLGLAIAAAGDLGESVSRYEVAMYARSSIAAAMSAEGLRMAVTSNGSRELVAALTGRRY